MKTSSPKPVAPKWFVVDAADQHLGRLATKIAHVIGGKHKPTFSPHLLMSDHVIVLNVEKVVLFGRKAEQKEYIYHRGYFGHLKRIPFARMIKENPEKVLTEAVRGMLGRNKLRDRKMACLHVFQGTEHPHEAQKPESLEQVFPSLQKS